MDLTSCNDRAARRGREVLNCFGGCVSLLSIESKRHAAMMS
jgi:hypothetical protein